jgi:hypothetical protein
MSNDFFLPPIAQATYQLKKAVFYGPKMDKRYDA